MVGNWVPQLTKAELPHLPPGPHSAGGPGHTLGLEPLLGLGGTGQYTIPARLHVMVGVFAGALSPQLLHIPLGPPPAGK
jgi:hypothetical protein